MMLTEAGTDLQQNTDTGGEGRHLSTSQDSSQALPMSLGWVLGSMVPKGPGGQLGISARMAEGKWKGKNRDTKASTK